MCAANPLAARVHPLIKPGALWRTRQAEFPQRDMDEENTDQAEPQTVHADRNVERQNGGNRAAQNEGPFQKLSQNNLSSG